MAYREVDVLLVREALRRWRGGSQKKVVARELGLCPKTVRRWFKWALAAGAAPPADAPADAVEAWLDAASQAVLGRRVAERHRPEGESWRWCEEHRTKIEALLAERHYGRPLTLRTVHRRLGKPTSYATLHRFATRELGFGRPEPTVPVADCKPGEELQVDTGWVCLLAMDAKGTRRRVKAWIFTSVLSRHRFVWPIARETTVEAIEACEAAWTFFGGVFEYLIVDNTKAVVETPDPVSPKIVRAFLEYSQKRDFKVTPARSRRPKDKARVERAVRTVRDDCFGGEKPRDLAQARQIAERWCRDEYGMRTHTTTGRRPREHFEAVERPVLGPCPEEPYEVPTRYRPIVQAQYARVASALYSVPPDVHGQIDACATRSLVRLYVGSTLVALHARVGKGERSTDANHFPAGKLAAANRDREFFVSEAMQHGASVGAYARAIFDNTAFHQGVRRVSRLRELVRRYGAARVDDACRIALAADLVDVARLGGVLEQASVDTSKIDDRPRGQLIKLNASRFARPPGTYRLRPSRPGDGSSA